ncbi:MAG TPA: hypothetical protein VMT16_00230 [Thermoanaerobaculia bacterium]|nr:hypothetical protein [Thermoanaerobaculia bacterium]
MHAVAAILIGLYMASPWSPGALDRQLQQAAERQALPLDFARQAAPALLPWVHQHRGWVMAALLPASDGGARRLALYEPFYLRGTRLVDVADMPVDVAEHYFHALLVAGLERAAGDPASEIGSALRQRAEARMADLPPPHRLEAFVDALASFGSHLLAMANELERQEARRRARSSSLCGHLDRDVPLLRLWEDAFAAAPYPGGYAVAEPGAPGRLRYSRATLSPADKRLLVATVLAGRWRGEARADFGPRFCGEPGPS